MILSGVSCSVTNLASSVSALEAARALRYPPDHERLWTVLPDSQGGGDCRRAVDPAGSARTRCRQYALQRFAARCTADVFVAAVAAPKAAGDGRRGRAATGADRSWLGVSPDPGRARARAPDHDDGQLGRALGSQPAGSR